MEQPNEKNGGSAPREAGEVPSGRRFFELYEWVEQAVQVVVVVVLLFTFVARTSVVSGASMVQTLQHGDMLIISRLLYRPQAGDIVVVTKPNFEDEPIVKRIIATEGQHVDIDFDAGVVFVDGQPLNEPYANTPTNLQYDT
ncbi:MAG: signal peptidase I, partial [Oscillospiraceae bacterium]